MKLYTEEQVRESLNDNFNFGDRAIDFALSKLIPIELPSDEEIEKEIMKWDWINQYYERGFSNGVKWMKEQILNQNK